MAKLDTNRAIRFNSRWNWNDNKPEHGFCQISGESGFPNAKITITYKYWDESLKGNADFPEHTDKDGFTWNVENGQIIILT